MHCCTLPHPSSSENPSRRQVQTVSHSGGKCHQSLHARRCWWCCTVLGQLSGCCRLYAEGAAACYRFFAVSLKLMHSTLWIKLLRCSVRSGDIYNPSPLHTIPHRRHANLRR